MPTLSQNYFASLRRFIEATLVTYGQDANGLTSMVLDEGLKTFIRQADRSHTAGNKLMFVGNGGSAGICSHMATDYSKNGGLRSLSFNSGSVLTCLGNDYGYPHVFEEQIKWHGRPGDVLIAISSSGRSENILRAADMGKEMGCYVVTLSGFSEDNPLRMKGTLNFYLPSQEYGFVEVGHLALLHAALDLKSQYLSA
jgi:D-sedoheptulose 7-phosphate isomerase